MIVVPVIIRAAETDPKNTGKMTGRGGNNGKSWKHRKNSIIENGVKCRGIRETRCHFISIVSHQLV